MKDRDTTMHAHHDNERPGFIRRNLPLVAAGTVVGLALLTWVAIGFFGVHTLFFDDKVDEAGPVFASGAGADADDADTAAPATDDGAAPIDERVAETAEDETAGEAPAETAVSSESSAPAAPAEAEIVTVAQGTFSPLAHPAEGIATVLTDGSAQRFLRFEEFATDNGPDLNVYLVPGGDVDAGFVDLGDLKGNIGDQNYEIPPDVDLSVYDTVVIWCVRFSSGFGEATLAAT